MTVKVAVICYSATGTVHALEQPSPTIRLLRAGRVTDAAAGDGSARRTNGRREPMTVLEHEKAFREAWKDPAATRYELTPLDVNKVLADRNVLGEPVVFTRAMRWDLEARKARHPDVFIPYVVAAGSAAAWGDEDVFVRKSMQRLWLDPETYGLVLE